MIFLQTWQFFLKRNNPYHLNIQQTSILFKQCFNKLIIFFFSTAIHPSVEVVFFFDKCKKIALPLFLIIGLSLYPITIKMSYKISFLHNFSPKFKFFVLNILL